MGFIGEGRWVPAVAGTTMLGTVGCWVCPGSRPSPGRQWGVTLPGPSFPRKREPGDVRPFAQPVCARHFFVSGSVSSTRANVFGSKNASTRAPRGSNPYTS